MDYRLRLGFQLDAMLVRMRETAFDELTSDDDHASFFADYDLLEALRDKYLPASLRR